MIATGDGRADMALKNLNQQLQKALRSGLISENEYARAMTLIQDLHTIIRATQTSGE